MKYIISFILRKIPRKYIQYVSHYVLRTFAIFYRGNNVQCPVDGRTYRKFLPYGRIESRPNALCPSSLSLERHRLMWLYMKEKTNFFSARIRLLHIAPELCFIEKFRKMENLQYLTADIESPLADVKMDVHKIPFEDGAFDVVFCNHVMEHVDDDILAMSEIHRVLNHGGWALIQSPVYMELPETIEDRSVTDPKERERLFGQSDHQRKYGRDYGDRLRKAGFRVTDDNFLQTLSEDVRKRYALPEEEIIYFCEKV
ncbi:MAG: methyltransferase domain-containing protein [Cyclobacteriaceae bacterium]|nr:methyltransferase domain-containing protein [Cyclobacteriaceae bacterium]